MSAPLRILICLTAMDAWYGRLIQWATNSRVNHSLFKHEDPFWGGWRATEIDEEGPHDKNVSRVQRVDYIEHWECDIDLLPALRKMGKFVGSAGYDWWGLLYGLVRAIWLKLTRREIEEAVHSNGRWFCSEFVAAVLVKAKVPGTEEWVAANVSPGMLRKFFLSSPHFKQVTDPMTVEEE